MENGLFSPKKLLYLIGENASASNFKQRRGARDTLCLAGVLEVTQAMVYFQIVAEKAVLQF